MAAITLHFNISPPLGFGTQSHYKALAGLLTKQDKGQWSTSSKQVWLSVSVVAQSWLRYSQISD